MQNLWKILFSRGWQFFLFIFLILVAVPVAMAAYEIDESQITSDVPTDGTIVQWGVAAGDVTIQWDAVAMTGTDAFNGFIYKWTESATGLSDDDFNEANNDGTIGEEIVPPNVTMSASDFAADDSDKIRYLHIKTWYTDNSSTPNPFAYSDDVVVGPINIDNVAPAGTICITDGEGNDIESTRNSLISITLSAAVAPVKVYLSETSSRPAEGADYAAEIDYDLGSESGEKTIYAWFEDSVGNISPAPTTDSVTLLAQVSISPYETTIDLATVATQDFTVDGTEDSYNWTIIDPVPDETVAQFSGSASGNSVTVEALNAGSFKLQATPSVGDALTSGTITVVEGTETVSKTFSLITTETTNTNTIGFVLESTGITTAHELGTAVGNCTQVAKWNAQTQSYLSHRMQFATLNNFTLNMGEAYFVTITSDHDFTLTGTVPASHTHTLITTATTNTNAVGVPNSKNSITTAHDLGLDIGNCGQVSKWDAQTQSYLSHRMQFQTLNNFTVDWAQGYFVTVTQETNWSW